MREYRDVGVEVPGGTLAVRRWPGTPGAGTVLAVHGITGNGLSWAGVAEALDGVEVLAPDLRGRGRSGDVKGESSMAVHADDLLAVLDHFGVGRAVLAGHSMGGFVGCVAAHRDPGRYRHLVLVDGGLGFPVPADMDIDQVLHAVIGPAMAKLDMEFADRAAYHAFWAGHPAFAELGGEAVRAYLDRDLVGEEPHLRSACRAAAIRQDAEDELRNPEVFAAIHRLRVPAELLWAERGLRDEPVGLYPPEVVEAAALTTVSTRFVPGVNHYSILLGTAGAATVAERVRAALVAGA
ncbi:alpha/beta hydrolase [Streptomyces cocklensis]|uniref:Pimeloyl-ACP methyl ester carboxylesterase n=1 Tax=Actinacidiphila cocklensis TaxID=887465 RepID=A0A9W4E279_9ACTN|nr:alpha/beta hydrolase [Actinacidiphila cocklensis]MDD1061906.1 alpha/beta hydrolase [Actinacidiphila cocklensis]WSX74649.1 alpha/beta hydrolase [Streptomyces sp. NBC_00899]CAG6391307.1 Pimeloyl-ACP methyl ester carboxylesterase [Actinacidiphila cocklensis]